MPASDERDKALRSNAARPLLCTGDRATIAPMASVELLPALQTLVPKLPGSLGEIRSLLAKASESAELQVAREWLACATRRQVDALLRSRDPAERRQGLALVGELYSIGRQSKILRRMGRDPDLSVRRIARKVLFQSRIQDVALRDFRFDPPDYKIPGWPNVVGGYNPSGWGAGLFRNGRSNARHSVSHRRRPERFDTGATAAERKLVPTIDSVEDLAEILGVDGELTRYFRPGAGPGSAYVEFDVPKANGTTRRLAAPRAALKQIQRSILHKILAPLPVHDACHAYTPGRSLVSNALPHQGAALLVKSDLRDFFPTIHYRRVWGLFSYYGYSTEVAIALAKLTTYQPVLADGTVIRPGILPQGAPTSPAIANLICRQLDGRLSGLARRLGARYTRYADDLTFSFPHEPDTGLGRFFWWLDQICTQEGFEENTAKRRVLRPHQRQLVTGVVVNRGQSVPRKARRRFRALLHQLRTRGVDKDGRSAESLRAYVFGYAAYIKMVQPELGARFMSEARALYQR